MENFINLLKATRISRTLTALAAIMVPAAFADKINSCIFYLALVCVLVYAVTGIHNAKKDNDYELPKNFKIFSAVLLIAALLLSFKHYIILVTFILWGMFGAVYNTIARFILFADVTLLSLTHQALPVLSASLLVGLNFKAAILLAAFIFITSWFIIHIKNLKDTKEDKKRGYKTATVILKQGIGKTKLFFEISFLCMFLGYFIFDLSDIYLYSIIGLLVLKIIITYFIDQENHETALNIARLMNIVFLIALIIDRTNSYTILFISLMIGVAYLVFLGVDVVKMRSASKVAN